MAGTAVLLQNSNPIIFKTINLRVMRTFTFSLFIFLLLASGSKLMAQDEMKPPPPIQNETFEMALGEWVSEPYTMLGFNITQDRNKIYMAHNGQFMVVEVDATMGDGSNYTATIFCTLDGEGNLKGWAFDTWGYYGRVDYTGSVLGNVMTLSGSNEFTSETRVITIEKDRMIHNVDFTVKLPTGDMNEKLEITYNRK